MAVAPPASGTDPAEEPAVASGTVELSEEPAPTDGSFPSPAPFSPGERLPVLIDAETPDRAAAAPRRKRRRERRRLASRSLPAPKRFTAAAALLAVLVLPALLAGRSGVVRAVPESAVLFAALGLPVNLVGLDLFQVTSSLGRTGDKPELVVEGEIRNPSAHPLPVPPVTITIRSEDGSLLYHWSVAAQDVRLAGGESTRFRARLASPPPAGRSVAVSFRAGPGAPVVASR